jgi:hypothetical protein
MRHGGATYFVTEESDYGCGWKKMEVEWGLFRAY